MRALPLVALVASLAACDGAVEDAPVDFGNGYYRVVEGDGRPALDGDRLRVDVQYGGGCTEHAFEPRARTRGGAAEVWLVHDSGGDSCLALVGTALDLPLPREASGARRVSLLTPGGAAVRLR